MSLAQSLEKSSENSKTEKLLFFFLKFEFILAILLCFSAIFLITLGFDEAWIIYSPEMIFSKDHYIYTVIEGVTATGGLYTVIESIIYFFAKNSVWAYRLFPFISFLILIFLIYRSGDHFKLNPQSKLLALSTIFAVPGTLIFSASGYGTLPAYLLLFTGLLCMQYLTRYWVRVITVGILFGLAGATRWECGFIIPAYILWGFTYGFKKKGIIVESLLTSVLAFAVFFFCFSLLYILYDNSFSDLVANNVASVGLFNSLRDHSRILNHFIVANGFMPIYVMVFATLVGIYLLSKGLIPKYFGILLWFSWLVFVFWVLKSPIPHLRYLWAALFSFALIAGYGIAFFYEWCKENNQRLIAFFLVLLSISFLAVSIITITRSILLGESNIISWEWSGETALARSRAFRYIKDQNQMAEYLRQNIPKNEEIGAIGLSLELGFISDIQIYPLEWYKKYQKWNENDLPKRLLITPMVGYFLYLKPEGYLWVKNECELEVQFGDYSLYKVKGNYPNYDVLECLRISHPPHPLSLKI